MTDELLALIGQEAIITIDKLEINVRLIDVKVSYGNERVLVEPVAGQGQVWVDVKRITLI